MASRQARIWSTVLVTSAVLLRGNAQAANNSSNSTPNNGSNASLPSNASPGAVVNVNTTSPFIQRNVSNDSSSSCQGTETTVQTCNTQRCPSSCTPRDCTFQDWNQWTNEAGCNGLAYRTRNVGTVNNDCGKPCNGVLEETKSVTPPSYCNGGDVNCAFQIWSDWSRCNSSTAQMKRHRGNVVPQKNGVTCNGTLMETKPCGAQVSMQDCSFKDWQDWTACSATCGDGYATRYRVVDAATHDGASCNGTKKEWKTCNVATCNLPAVCVLGDWMQWAGCDSMDPMQKTRTRKAATPGTTTGCIGPVKETIPCPSATGAPRTCELSPWSNWDQCTATCHGETRRFRTIKNAQALGGTCPHVPTEELASCGTGAACQPMQCKFTPWETWSACSALCGKGIHIRRRTVTELPQGDPYCTNVLQQVEGCQVQPCSALDCKWGQWEQWSGCTLTCGGGTMRRNRVIVQSPQYGGVLCDPLAKKEVQACNTQSCQGTCVDGQWDMWATWSTCSSTCGPGFQMRERNVLQEANFCGLPLNGSMEEFRECPNTVSCSITQDCVLADWSLWSACSNVCYGIRERHRVIAKYATGNGQRCIDAPLKVIEACNPATGAVADHACDATPERDCALEDWADWSACPVTCGGGQEMRTRHVLAPPTHKGKQCNVPISVTRPCAQIGCNHSCVNCVWGPWSDWGDCTECNGQRWRTRSIMQQPNHCGTPCEASSAKEVTNCTGQCNKQVMWCGWTDWSGFEGCSAECGPAVKRRERTLALSQSQPNATSYLFSGYAPLTCTHTIFDSVPCTTKPCQGACTPQPCVFNDWEPWAKMECDGLCQRHRTVKTAANECAPGCNGTLIETMACNDTVCNTKKDCAFHDWGQWTTCLNLHGQSMRSRGIRQLPRTGGTACQGTSRETRSCSNGTLVKPGDCSFTDWSQWTQCTVTCGDGGWQMRNRHPSFASCASGGLQCNGTLKEIRNCTSPPCTPTDCVIGSWSGWSDCMATNRRIRRRPIQVQSAPPGAACNASLEEQLPCGGGIKDCKLSSWTSWDACDKTCGNGQKNRHRQFETQPSNGGAQCANMVVHETAGCNRGTCSPDDCQVGAWGTWSTCSSSCGVGQRTRTRNITSNRKNLNAIGCQLSLASTEPCPSPPACPVSDCAWGDWTPYTSCSKTCGGGYQRRSRGMRTNATAGGKHCSPQPKEELAPCNTQLCAKPTSCVDGSWNTWSPWSACSTHCGGGIMQRSRTNIQANSCGKPALGSSAEVASCNTVSCDTTQDCVFSTWTAFGACTASCYGTKERTRSITQQGKGNGTFCKGALREVYPCNPTNKIEGNAGSGMSTVPSGCPNVTSNQDCSMNTWSSWGNCSATCGGGQQSRSRTIKQLPAGNGTACNTSMAETQGCNTQKCANDTRVDCKWGDWSSWGGCDCNTKQMQRSRQVVQQAANGGANCQPGVARETMACNATMCPGGNRYYCIWGDWGSWSTCTKTCDTGNQQRSRGLKVATAADLSSPGLVAPSTFRLFEEQQLRAAEASASGSQQPARPLRGPAGAEGPEAGHRGVALVAAFGGGVLAVLLVMAAGRLQVCHRGRLVMGHEGANEYCRTYQGQDTYEPILMEDQSI